MQQNITLCTVISLDSGMKGILRWAVEVWPDLPEHIKSAVKALIDTHVKDTDNE